MLRNTATRFGSLTKSFHWLIFALVGAQFFLILGFNLSAENSPEKLRYMLTHKSIGVTVLALAILFVIWKRINIQPRPVAEQPGWQHLAATIVHYSMLLLIVILPILGYLLACSVGKLVSYFGLFTFPCLISENKHLSALFDAAHIYLGFLLLLLIGVHIFAALYHHFYLKDNVLKRMLPTRRKHR